MNVLDGSAERAAWWRLADPGAPELLHAAFRTRTFNRHAHDRFAIGVIEAGGLAFRYRGQEVVAPAGWVNLAFPGEVHSGRGTTAEGWAYRMFYLDPAHMLAAAQACDPSIRELPFVPAGAVWDPDLAGQVSRLHRLCLDPGADALERQTGMATLIQGVLQRHGSLRPGREEVLAESAVRRAREVLEDLAGEALDLEDLASQVGLNPYTLVRHFTRTWGLPPHAYLVQVRVNRAAAFLRQGMAPAQAASECGFADQSHLNRHFLRQFGLTPGAYRRGHPAPRGR